MAQPDNIGTPTLVFDEAKRAANFQISGWRSGQPFVISGRLAVPVPPGVLQKDIEYATKERLKELFNSVIAGLR